MGSDDVCTGAGAPKDPTHKSLPDALDARAGSTALLLDGVAQPTHYEAGASYRLTVVPGHDDAAANNETWFLLDAEIGQLNAIAGEPFASWRTQCKATRASFASASGAPVSMIWAVPPAARGPIVLRVATATTMGNLSVNALVLNASGAAAPLPAGAMGYACSRSRPSAHSPWPLQQCQSVPPGTPGALNQSACEAACLVGAGATFRCTRCAHVYDAKRDGGGLPFEQLPDTWKCPLCGAPKSAYAKQTDDDGAERWVHVDEAEAQGAAVVERADI